MAFARKVYELPTWLGRITDRRRKPVVSSGLVGAVVFFAGLLRIRSFNALEPRLLEKPFRRLVGGVPKGSLRSVDTVSRALRAMDLETVRRVSVAIVAKAERNKVFREGWHGALRHVAVDGWEPISLWVRHCPQCLVRKVKVKGRDGEIGEVEQFYHRYAVAMLIGPRFDLLLDFEPLLPADLRPPVVKGKKRDRLVVPDEDEGELTAATRLIRRVKKTFSWIDVTVADGLYSNGPFLTTLKDLSLGGVIGARKEKDEPLREALNIWQGQAPEVIETESERIELWDCPDLETLKSYEGPIRVARGRVTDLSNATPTVSTWCMLATGKPARPWMRTRTLLDILRGRWHLENTGFHQWTTRWHFGHAFTHDARGLQALFWLFFAAYNTLTLFLYCQLRSYGRDRKKDVTRTISRLIDEMLDDLARFGFLVPDSS